MAKALVTGGTSGIGRAIAEGLASCGHEVTVFGRNEAALEQMAQTDGIRAARIDISDRAAVARALDGETVEILVNNAGIMPLLGPFQDSAIEDADAAIAANLTAHVALTRMVVSGMCARRSGHVFFTGSTAGHAPFPGMAVYCATKAAIGGFAQALRLDLSIHNVRVTEIVAGRVETKLYEALLDEEKRAAMYAGATAVQPRDVAEMLLAVLALPAAVDVSRFDIVPTRQPAAPKVSKENRT